MASKDAQRRCSITSVVIRRVLQLTLQMGFSKNGKCYPRDRFVRNPFSGGIDSEETT